MATSLGDTFGAALIGLFASAVLHGVTILQTFRYFRRYPKDATHSKILVVALWSADITQLILCIWSLYWYLVTNFGNYDNLFIPYWTMNVQIVINGGISVCVKLMFAWRVYKFSHNKITFAIIITLSLFSGALCGYFTMESFILDDFAEYTKLRWVICAALGSSTAANILIAGSLCYYLRQMRSGFSRSNTLIAKIMFYALNTGVLTSIAATTALVTFAAMPTNFVWLSFFWILGRFYVNSLLATMNYREPNRAKLSTSSMHVMSTLQLPNHYHSADEYSLHRDYKTTPLVVRVETTTETIEDQIDHHHHTSVRYPSALAFPFPPSPVVFKTSELPTAV
ncbi:hypothetical protein BD410DRAFT_796209 [Rickenella mellea]|uniref:DUF6534 domain-containing protein n=1 Tax=Rickenella mellea TaxID=50990 RepID=A0A4Y7PJI0_9AGAM|nr:hypothetical protein BD410DRAFT_796209 [Rickenella mellea]